MANWPGWRRPTRRDVVKALLTGAVGLSGGAASYGYLYERYRVGVTRQTVAVAGLPEALAGLRVGLLTDPHVSPSVPDIIVTTAVELLQAEKPDVILLGGDFISWQTADDADRAAELMKPFAAPLGVFGVLGNHDEETQLPRALTERGITLLRDSTKVIEARGVKVTLIGLRYWTRRAAALAKLKDEVEGFPVLVAHDPRRLREATSVGLPLVISGHTHGGQVVLPGLGAIAAKRYPIDAGLLVDGSTTLFVSRGVGTVYLPWRVNCPPEVAVLTLQPAFV
ncbi:MAG: metallophosphoesterase [Vicinamibacterales bacterium]